MATVELRNITKVYEGGVKAVDSANLTINDKEFVVLVGPSGCGKTTTLRLIAGLEAVSQGSIHIAGAEVTNTPAHRRNVAMLFQSPALYPQLTVRKNLAFGRVGSYTLTSWWSRRSVAETRQIESTAQLLGVEKLLDRRPAELSGGERQRAALGRAMLRHPAVFLLDEPLAHVDPTLRMQLRSDLRRVQNEQRSTLIWVTHDHAEALAVADRIGVMAAGELLQVGTPAEVYEQPHSLSVARLIGQPPMNLLPGSMAGYGSEITLGVRPHDLRVGPSDQGIPMTVVGFEYGEPLGHVTLRQHELVVTAAVPASTKPALGSTVGVSWEWSKMHQFNRNTGLRLQTPPPS
jgi:multiple sugar transport system ATP-binding protein